MLSCSMLDVIEANLIYMAVQPASSASINQLLDKPEEW